MIYSQSFFGFALREDSSKSNSRGVQGVIFSTSWQSFVARGVPPIYFGRVDGVERALLMEAPSHLHFC